MGSLNDVKTEEATLAWEIKDKLRLHFKLTAAMALYDAALVRSERTSFKHFLFFSNLEAAASFSSFPSFSVIAEI